MPRENKATQDEDELLELNQRAEDMYYELSQRPMQDDRDLQFLLNAAVEVLDALTLYTNEDAEDSDRAGAIALIYGLVEKITAPQY